MTPEAIETKRQASRERARPQPIAGCLPRVLDCRQAAWYLNVSVGTVRDYIAAGRLRPVTLPALVARPGERQQAQLRRVLLDVAELNRFVEACSK
jgi:hypothetical protein